MLIFFFVFFFAVKYRRKSPDDPAPRPSMVPFPSKSPGA